MRGKRGSPQANSTQPSHLSQFLASGNRHSVDFQETPSCISFKVTGAAKAVEKCLNLSGFSRLQNRDALALEQLSQPGPITGRVGRSAVGLRSPDGRPEFAAPGLRCAACDGPPITLRELVPPCE